MTRRITATASNEFTSPVNGAASNAAGGASEPPTVLIRDPTTVRPDAWLNGPRVISAGTLFEPPATRQNDRSGVHASAAIEVATCCICDQLEPVVTVVAIVE